MINIDSMTRITLVMSVLTAGKTNPQQAFMAGKVCALLCCM